MMKGIIFDSEEHAMQMDAQHNRYEHQTTKYVFNRKPLKATTTITKSDWAVLYGIPDTIVNDEGNVIANPKYDALESSYTVHKSALMVGESLTQKDDDGNITGYSCPYCGEVATVVEITDDLLKPLGGI